jgi:hypothetical protein
MLAEVFPSAKKSKTSSLLITQNIAGSLKIQGNRRKSTRESISPPKFAAAQKTFSLAAHPIR